VRKRRVLMYVGLTCLLVIVGVACALRSLRRRAKSLTCIDNLHEIVYQGKQWATARDGLFPTNFMFLSDVWDLSFALCCPSDPQRQLIRQTPFLQERSSYELITPGVASSDTNTVFVRCKIHGYVAYPDGTCSRSMTDSGHAGGAD